MALFMIWKLYDWLVLAPKQRKAYSAQNAA